MHAHTKKKERGSPSSFSQRGGGRAEWGGARFPVHNQPTLYKPGASGPSRRRMILHNREAYAVEVNRLAFLPLPHVAGALMRPAAGDCRRLDVNFICAVGKKYE